MGKDMLELYFEELSQFVKDIEPLPATAKQNMFHFFNTKFFTKIEDYKKLKTLTGAEFTTLLSPEGCYDTEVLTFCLTTDVVRHTGLTYADMMNMTRSEFLRIKKVMIKYQKDKEAIIEQEQKEAAQRIQDGKH